LPFEGDAESARTVQTAPIAYTMPLSIAETSIAVEISAIDERGLPPRVPAVAVAQYVASAPIISVTARIILGSAWH